MVIAGGIGNMIDRIALGYVIDFIELTFVRFAVFNAAISA
jgi:signal peptidase II